MLSSKIFDTSSRTVSGEFGAYSRLKSTGNSFLDLLVVSNLLAGTSKIGQAWGAPCITGIVLNDLCCRNDAVVDSYDNLAYMLEEKQTARPNFLDELSQGYFDITDGNCMFGDLAGFFLSFGTQRNTYYCFIEVQPVIKIESSQGLHVILDLNRIPVADNIPSGTSGLVDLFGRGPPLMWVQDKQPVPGIDPWPIGPMIHLIRYQPVK